MLDNLQALNCKTIGSTIGEGKIVAETMFWRHRQHTRLIWSIGLPYNGTQPVKPFHRIFVVFFFKFTLSRTAKLLLWLYAVCSWVVKIGCGNGFKKWFRC